MSRAPLDCPGSWLPVHYVQPGHVIACPLCGRTVRVTAPPPDDCRGDPWLGSKETRLAVHWYPPQKAPPQ
jgi:hypothetical protein